MVAFILVMAMGICKAMADTLADHHGQSIFPGPWGKSNSWRNKWEEGNPAMGEKFPGSSTVFVFLTDPWHFANAIQYTAMAMAIVLYRPVFSWWADAILLKCVFTITFEVFYRWVLIKKV